MPFPFMRLGASAEVMSVLCLEERQKWVPMNFCWQSVSGFTGPDHTEMRDQARILVFEQYTSWQKTECFIFKET